MTPGFRDLLKEIALARQQLNLPKSYWKKVA